jgi:hypothetical protein
MLSLHNVPRDKELIMTEEQHQEQEHFELLVRILRTLLADPQFDRALAEARKELDK